VLLSSDEIREGLSHNQRRRGERVFAEMHERLRLALLEGKRVVLDSTGMSVRFRTLLHAHRAQLLHVHLRLHDPKRFEERERQRTDRPNGPLPHAAFKHSQSVFFHEPPDLIIATDEISPDDVYRLVSAALSS
jgi:predicted kinase